MFARHAILFHCTSEAGRDSIRTHGGPPEEHIEDNRIPKGLSSLLIPPRNGFGEVRFGSMFYWATGRRMWISVPGQVSTS